METHNLGCDLSVGTNTPPTIAATPVPTLPPPIGVNGYSSVPAPTNGQQATEALYTNGVHPYQGNLTRLNSFRLCGLLSLSIFFILTVFFCFLPPAQSPAALDPLQQAYAGMQHYTGWCLNLLNLCQGILNIVTSS